MHVKRLAIVSASLFLAGTALAAPAAQPARKHTVFITEKLDAVNDPFRRDLQNAIKDFRETIRRIDFSTPRDAEFSYLSFAVESTKKTVLWSEFALPAHDAKQVREDCKDCGVDDLFDKIVKETLFRRARLYVGAPVKSCSVTPQNEVTIAITPQNLVGIEPRFHYAVRVKTSPSSIPGLILAPHDGNEVNEVTAKYLVAGTNTDGFLDRCRAGTAGGFYLLMPYTRLPTDGTATNGGFSTVVWP